jgi:hypothetical protein
MLSIEVKTDGAVGMVVFKQGLHPRLDAAAIGSAGVLTEGRSAASG